MIQVHESGGVRAFRMARSLLGRGVYFTAAYWVDGLLIDTGCAYTDHELITALEGLNVEGVINTHSHEDHVGGNAAVQGRYGAEVLIHPLGLPLLAEPRRSMVLRPYQRLMWGYPAPSTGRPIGTHVQGRHHTFQVIHVPGHSPDHIALFEADRGWLFCGDAYIGGRDRALRADYNIWQIIGSLKEMARFRPERLFPGSGRVRDDAQGALLDKIQYLEEVAGRVLSLHQRGWAYGRIRRELFGAESLMAYATLGHFSGMHLVRSFIEDRPHP